MEGDSTLARPTTATSAAASRPSETSASAVGGRVDVAVAVGVVRAVLVGTDGRKKSRCRTVWVNTKVP